MVGRLCLLGFAACLCLTQAAFALDIGPDAAPGITAVGAIDPATIQPGALVRLHAGHYRNAIVVTMSGTAASPIIIEGAGDGGITLAGPIVLDHAAFVVLRHLRIDHADDAGIILRHFSHDVAVQSNTITDTRLGIWIGDHAGDHNRIEDNAITRSVTHGIAVDGVNAAPDRRTLIARNRITDSGVHGIELSGNYYAIEDNVVSLSGRTSSGTSGIHVFAPGPGVDVCRHNTISGNISFANRDPRAQDGNGIQLDQWCDDNTVSGNIVSGNDGAGISVFDAAHARITGNTLYGNMRDPAHSHRHRGELVFATDDEHDADNTQDGLAASNIVVAVGRGVASVVVDRRTARHPPHFANNLLSAAPGATIARWAGRDIATIAEWNGVAPHAGPDLGGNPRFTDTTRPADGGFALPPNAPGAWLTLGAQGPRSPHP